MQADWEFEADGAAPVIDACWHGFVDLRVAPDRVFDLPEARQCPALAEALLKLNAPGSAVWTSKCDYFSELEPGEFDSDELDAPPGSATHACGCYIDLLLAAGREWAGPEGAAEACRDLCRLLHDVPQRLSRVDLVIRRAVIAPDGMDLGITAYLTACGPAPEAAAAALADALAAFAQTVSTFAVRSETAMKLQ